MRVVWVNFLFFCNSIAWFIKQELGRYYLVMRPEGWTNLQDTEPHFPPRILGAPNRELRDSKHINVYAICGPGLPRGLYFQKTNM